ncbi:hypothetical protein A4G19_03215 [Pasteurellaceae bacterium Macca]|nr:hypothetical protein [Pasteurellaceae bacterium Macca]
MTQNNNMRKEPTFGTSNPVNDTQEIKNNATKVNVSVRSNQSPGHTFTPVMKRPVETAQDFATMEEQAQQSAQSAKSSGFAFAPVVENQPTSDNSKKEELEKTAVNEEKTPSENLNTSQERIIPTVSSSEKPATIEKIPGKYRRLILVILLALALLLVFFLLKPKAPETVEALQEQGTNLPIDFRSVNEADAKRAEEKAKELAQQAQQQAQVQQQNEQPSQQGQAIATVPSSADSVIAAQPTASANNATTAPLAETAKPVEIKPIVVEPVKKPTVSGSVIYQAEHSSPTQTVKTVEKAKEHKVERLVKATPTPPAKTEQKKGDAQRVERTASTSAVQVKQPTLKETSSATSANGVVSSKTLTVPKGVSLMQLFRENNLNIADVNAMGKANNAVSNLKVGEKVVVRLDKHNRVAEMSVGAGKYTRQANGSYTFK